VKKVYFALALAIAVSLLGTTAAARELRAPVEEYVVLYSEDASLASARLAVEAVGARVVTENTDVGVATVSSANPMFFEDVSRQPALAGAAREAPIGRTAPIMRPKRAVVERLTASERASARAVSRRAAAPPADPLAGLQWGNAMIHATVTGSYSTELGNRGVRVGIIDTGVDGSHPDIAPNFDAGLSRNFTTDIPLVDGPCADEPDQSCNDPANVDENGHGTHVAGIVGAALNGLGTAGVAPSVTLVNIRAGQDSGYFFLQPTVDALTYAGDNGVDVVNMSYFVDPWLFNCAANPADSPEAQLEQRTIVEATNRALDYAWKRGVTLIGSEGNEHTDLGSPTVDDISPDFPPGTEYHRNVDNSCLVIPTEGNNVISIGAVGPSTIKADYSNWGLEQTAVTAPGGYFRDFAGTPQNRQVTNLVLSAFPESVGRRSGAIDQNGNPTTPFVVKNCNGGTCAYYQYLQGTSMAAPHAVGVAALIVSRWGHPDQGRPTGQLTMKPKNVEKVLTRTATDHACPDPPLIDYTIPGRDRPASFNALCTGTAAFNSIWGEGIVDALSAVTTKNP
jgi:subtilisin family serine protease